jgi:hypothetical protein
MVGGWKVVVAKRRVVSCLEGVANSWRGEKEVEKCRLGWK